MKEVILAGGLIKDSRGRILLIHRKSPIVSQWEVPGGKVEEGECASDAARREILEEIGITVSIVKEIGTCEFFEDGLKTKYIWFLAKIQSGRGGPLEVIYNDLGFFSWETLHTMNDLSPVAQKLVNAHFEGALEF